MFTEHGLVAILKFVFIVFLANGLDVLFQWWLGWEVKGYVYGFFLLTYLVNYERLELERKKLKKHLRDDVFKVTDL